MRGGAPSLKERLEQSPVPPILLTLAVYTLTAAGRAIIDADEGVYAHIPQQMLARGDWLTPYVNGICSLDKPPLLYWLIGACYSVFGVSEFAARIPAIFGVTGTTFLIQRIGGARAAFAFAFSVGTFLFTLEVMHDILMVFFLTLAMYCFWRILERPGPWPVLGFFAAAAGAFLAKGLIGVAFPFGIVVIYALVTREVPRVRLAWLAAGAVLFCALALPWHSAMEIANPGFLRIHFLEEQVLRFFARREPVDYESVPLLLFWILVPVWFFPWSAFLPAAVRRERDRVTVLAAVWFGLILLFFSVSSRLEHYAFPLLPPLAILAGRARFRTGYNILSAFGVVFLLIAVLLGAILATGYGLPSGGDGPTDSTYNNDFSIMLDFSGDLLRQLIPPAIAATLAMALGLLAARRVGYLSIVAAMVVVQFAAAYSLRVAEPEVSSKAVGEVLARVARPGDKVVILGDYESANSINFYAPAIQLSVCEGTAASLGPGLRYPDAPKLVLSTDDLRALWASGIRTFLLADEDRLPNLAPVHEVTRFRGRVLIVNSRIPANRNPVQ